MKYLSEGSRPSLEGVLINREVRRDRMDALRKANPGKSLICFKLNIPGPVKNNRWIMKLFREGLKDIRETCKSQEEDILSERIILRAATGPEAFLVIDGDPDSVKEAMVRIEDETPLGRLYDIDVEGDRGPVSREDLGLEERKCFLCDQPAKVCARSRTHSVEEMIDYIEDLLDQVGFSGK